MLPTEAGRRSASIMLPVQDTKGLRLHSQDMHRSGQWMVLLYSCAEARKLTPLQQLSFWIFDAIFDVVSNSAILALPIVLVTPLQMPVGRKFQAIAAFAFQIPACIFAIVRVIHLHKALSAQDHTWAAVDWQIWTSVSVNFNVIAASIPCLKMLVYQCRSIQSQYR